MRFVIWGAGQRGKRLLEFLGEDKIVAFIDEYKFELNIKFLNKDIISYDAYKRSFALYPIIVSMKRNEEALDLLNNDRALYFLYSDIQYIIQQDKCSIQRYREMLRDYTHYSYIYISKLNLLGIWIFEELNSIGYKNVTFLRNIDNIELQNIFGIENSCNEIDNRNSVIFSVEKDISYINDKYSNYRIEDMYFWEENFYKPIYPVLRQFKGKHLRKRCFIVANGPSLKIRDLDCLYKHGEICFGVNQIFRSFDKTLWRPNYYVVSDYRMASLYVDEIDSLNIKNMFIRDDVDEFWKFDHGDNIYKYHIVINSKVSNEISHLIYAVGTVVHVCLQIAIYMGFDKIYIIGADTNYKSKTKHFVDNYYKYGDEECPEEFDYNGTFIAYQNVRQNAKKLGVDIFNATRGGDLEIFPRVNFDQLF